ncbi:MAG: hypothetical protein ATN35_12775 [Epulopiscium sp. Nele67-Bin004]|nr:MAG: hypothetical protein ATN35_12775 [Epulopiscium sp. Nele67-Bin004]
MFIAPIIVGGLIGYITNSIAIKMLFRPLKPIYFLGKQLPFTPGIIPKEQARIAKEVGIVVQNELLDANALKQKLLSPEIQHTIENGVINWIMETEFNFITVDSYLKNLSDAQLVDHYKEETTHKLTKIICDKIEQSDLATPIVDAFEKAVRDNIGPMSMFIGDSLIDGIKIKAKDMIQEVIAVQSNQLVSEMVEDNVEIFMQNSVADATTQIREKADVFASIVFGLYKNFIEGDLRSISKN